MVANSTCSKLRWAVIHCPTLIPSIVNNPHLNKRLSQHILYDMLPRRTSIEIECFNNVAIALRHVTAERIPTSNSSIDSHRYHTIIKQFGLTDFAIDDSGPYDIDYQEHKISIANYTQLIGLYNILHAMSIHCVLNTSSGSHIHLGFSGATKIPGFRINTLCDYLTAQCKNGTIERIFGPAPARAKAIKCCDINCKSQWINLNTNYETIEFRCGSMTFDYSTIVTWFIKVNKILNNFENILNNANTTKSRPQVSYHGRIAL
jgi:hypothetical protein